MREGGSFFDNGDIFEWFNYGLVVFKIVFDRVKFDGEICVWNFLNLFYDGSDKYFMFFFGEITLFNKRYSKE